VIALAAYHHGGSSIATYLMHAVLWHVIGRVVFALPLPVDLVAAAVVLGIWVLRRWHRGRKADRFQSDHEDRPARVGRR
jgi:hypothetical protein